MFCMNIWIFDLDGVLTDPFQKKVIYPALLDELITRLKNHDLVAFNTGRTFEFIEKEVIDPLKQHLAIHNQTHLISNILAVGEKGAVELEFGEEEERKEYIDPQIQVPQRLVQSIHNLIRNKFSASMFFDSTKRTMISTEMPDNFSLEEYQKDQKRLLESMREAVKPYPNLIIEPNIIAIDIQDRRVGKHLGAQRILAWMRKKKASPDYFYCFGDSASDRDMAQEFAKEDKEVTFIYVGKDEVTQSPDFQTIRTKSYYTEGTLEYLELNR